MFSLIVCPPKCRPFSTGSRPTATAIASETFGLTPPREDHAAEPAQTYVVCEFAPAAILPAENRRHAALTSLDAQAALGRSDTNP